MGGPAGALQGLPALTANLAERRVTAAADLLKIDTRSGEYIERAK